MEDPTRLARRAGRRGLVLALAVGAALLGARAPAPAVEDAAAEIAQAIRSLGPPGALFGRVSVEEESPAGATTPLVGVEVTLYPATPAIQAELDRLRRGARDSGADYEAAVGRVLAALSAHQARVDAQSAGTPLERPTAPATETAERAPAAASKPAPKPEPPRAPEPRAGGRWGTPMAPMGRKPAGREGASGKAGAPEPPPEPPHPFRQQTDPGGVFAFASVPSGDWLVVAVRVAPYAGQRLREPSSSRDRGSRRSRQYFLRRDTGGPVKEAEVWIERVRLDPGERVGLELTDRTRWMVGPVR